ncbi:lipid IV(A) 3-deoxy-D-manno-octulosonic acid transferase [Marinospirillum alkaliphilum]|uniref:3-deoxy-D-manno-octulosonic acid transferase n=1 Tax=Marinospirillum alkaliphilum DSM 21637 TaxID=1122209 RepID=A0A1K1WQC4_9GAMM|nr:lipid IV(A) 3-deoxy-D-manno-octulosonic acid transferase [Marinospirillum alkaliphilum]SFX39610.1 3-deoxy-D-manno-octulosonic-acid transferase [Marinospirillum alkaliphilum DSM 21637]
MASLPRLIYTGLLLLLLPLINRRLERERLNALSARQRAGHVSPSELPVIWAHCASVGEVLAAEPLLRELQQQHPDKQLVVTTMTATGAAQVRQRLPEARHYLLPLDLPWNTDRFVATLKPVLGIIFETELWPNLIHSCQQAKVPLVIANGRLSEKAFRRYRRIRPLVREALQAVRCVAAKAQEDGNRFVALGLPTDRMEVSGSIKYDLQVPADLSRWAADLRSGWGTTRPVWIAASTHEGEDELLLQAHQQLLKHQPDTLLLLVPRHPQRFDQVAEQVAAQGFSYSRRSLQQPVTSQTQVYLGDTLGELLLLYAAADLAFVAGSLVPIGGHNLLEPAAVGVPVITGPHLNNFTEIAGLLRQAGALKEVADAAALPEALLQLWRDAEARQHQVQAGLQVVDANRGALKKQRRMIEQLLAEQDALADKARTEHS